MESTNQTQPALPSLKVGQVPSKTGLDDGRAVVAWFYVLLILDSVCIDLR